MLLNEIAGFPVTEVGLFYNNSRGQPETQFGFVSEANMDVQVAILALANLNPLHYLSFETGELPTAVDLHQRSGP